MQHEPHKLLDDIRHAADLILGFAHDRTIEDYGTDAMLRSAVERQFEIIGEALARLAKSDPQVAARVGEYKRIIAFRNVLIHGYDVVDEHIVWDAVQDKLPALREAVDALLKE